MELKILEFALLQEPAPVDADLLTSRALNLTGDGLLANAGGRFEDNVIALYEFKAGEGQVAYDTSGVSPALDLTLSGNVDWVGGWGINLGPAYQDDQGPDGAGGQGPGLHRQQPQAAHPADGLRRIRH